MGIGTEAEAMEAARATARATARARSDPLALGKIPFHPLSYLYIGISPQAWADVVCETARSKLPTPWPLEPLVETSFTSRSLDTVGPGEHVVKNT